MSDRFIPALSHAKRHRFIWKMLHKMAAVDHGSDKYESLLFQICDVHAAWLEETYPDISELFRMVVLRSAARVKANNKITESETNVGHRTNIEVWDPRIFKVEFSHDFYLYRESSFDDIQKAVENANQT